MRKKVVITVPKLTSHGGVSSYWNAILPELYKLEDIQIETLEVGGHGKNLLGPLIDQWNFKGKTSKAVDVFILNPSLGARSFFRDGIFAKQLVRKKINFFVFFHGWDLEFEQKVTKKYKKFFCSSFGKASKIFVLSNEFKIKLLEWGFQGEVIVETTAVDASLLNDFSIAQKLETTKKSDKIRILFLSRLLKEKGIFETIEAFMKLHLKFSKLELIIAGDGNEFDEVVTLVKNEKNIIVMGHVKGEEKINLFKTSQIYCLPSYSEGLPTSVLEAMAFGLPVITTPVGGLKAFFQDDKMGYFVPVKDAIGLFEKLELLLSENDTRNKMAYYNHNYAHKYLLSTIVSQRLYENLKSI